MVWATRGREARLTSELERQVYRCVTSEAERLGCSVLAIGGMPDHVHIVACTPGTVSPSILAKQAKGVSSAMINDLRQNFSEIFRWQDGYACFSLGRSQVATVVSYVKNQKQHHTNGTTWPDWEEADEEASDKE